LPSLPPPGRETGLWRLPRSPEESMHAGFRALCPTLSMGKRSTALALLRGGLLCLKRHTQQLKQPATLFIGAGAGYDRDLHATHLVNGVIVNLGEDELLADAQCVVSAAIKRITRNTLKVA